MMESIYSKISSRAVDIVISCFPLPDFYNDFIWANEISLNFFETNTVIAALRDYIDLNMENDFGHGVKHAVKVAKDAGMLIVIEGTIKKYQISDLYRLLLLAQTAGMLHDIKRKEKEHSIKGADFVRKFLLEYPFSTKEIEDIALSIINHEAFKDAVPVNTIEGSLISDCLYDADKFRWGPDNFTDTVWDMASYFNIPLSKFLEFYPKGIEHILKIKNTFRTQIGKKYGPQFIDLGVAIGHELYKMIKNEFEIIL